MNKKLLKQLQLQLFYAYYGLHLPLLPKNHMMINYQILQMRYPIT